MKTLVGASQLSIALTIPALGASLEAILMKAVSYIAAGKSPNTVRAYESDWRDFANWCVHHGLRSLPAAPSTVALYCADLAEIAKASTITRRLATIAKGHAVECYESPCSLRHAAVAEVLAGIRRSKGTMAASKSPLMVEDLRRIIGALPTNTIGTRDVSLLLFGYSGGFRRSELAALAVEDVEDTTEGVTITIRRGKADQEGAGRTVGIPYGSQPQTCPVRQYRAWLQVSGITAGPLFRQVDRHGNVGNRAITPQVVALVVKRACVRVGLDPTRFSAHSLRSGMATQSAKNGASERSIMRQTGHRSVVMVRQYIREAELFCDNAAARLGL
jgi:site-specific recombinase XerD